MKNLILSSLLAVASLLLTSCSSNVYTPLDKTPGASYEQGVPGGTVVETHYLKATVAAIDAPARKVTLETKEGKKATIKCGPDVANFDQIQVGDVVRALITDELTVAMADAANPPDSTTSLVALAPRGSKPAAVVAETQQYTATISALNLKRREATLLFPDGTTRTFAVRKDVDLSQRKVGERVTFRVTMSMALGVERL
jgi:Cu/Ag efflux protein CusF